MTGQHSDSCDVGPWEVRAAPVELPPAYTPCDGLNGSCFLPLGHDGDHL